MVRPLAGHTAVVTGGASGAGLAIARRLASAGADIVLLDDDETVGDAAARITGELGMPAMGARGRLHDEAFLATAFRAAIEHLDFPDVLVVAAAMGGPQALAAFDARLAVAGKRGTCVVVGDSAVEQSEHAGLRRVASDDPHLPEAVVRALAD